MIYGENPMTGQKIFAGETLTPGTVIAAVANRDQLRFVFWVHDADMERLSVGQKLTVLADALPNHVVAARVAWIANYAITRETWSQGGYFKLIADPETYLPGDFLPGMAVFAEVR